MTQQYSPLSGWLIAGGMTLMLTSITMTHSVYTSGHDPQAEKWFDQLIWLPFLIATSATLAAVVIRPSCRPNRAQLPIDSAISITQYSATSAGIILLYTGINIGFLCFSGFAETAEDIAMFLNLHFVGALLFVFSCFFWASKLFVETKPFQVRPTDNALFSNIRKVDGGKTFFFARLASLTIITTVTVVLLSGLIKVFARLVDFSPNIIAAINLIHGAATLVLLLLIPVHTFLAGILSWTFRKSHNLLSVSPALRQGN